jgi:hypothetical protein
MKTLAKAATRTEDVHHLLTDTLPLRCHAVAA